MDTSYDGEQVNVVLYMHADNSVTDWLNSLCIEVGNIELALSWH